MSGIKKTMDEWKHGQLHSGSKKGPIVHSQKQAVAIALSEQRKAGGKSAPKKHNPIHNLGHYAHPKKGRMK